MKTDLARRRRVVGYAAAAVISVLASCFVLAAAGFHYNWTPSYPLGFYRSDGSQWRKGDLVMAEFPTDEKTFQIAVARGYLHVGIVGEVPLLKRVVAVAGDHVVVADDVSVNGVTVPNSRLLTYDSNGARIPHAAVSETVKPGYVWLLSDYSPQSFDSRYFGPMPVKYIRCRIKPFLTW